MGKMKDSSLLKWAHNNNRNNSKGKSKEEKNKNWIHPAESLVSGHIAYLVKFLGCTEVDKPKGIEVVKDGIRKLKFTQQIKKAEGSKTPKVELTVSVNGVAIQDPKTKKIQHQYPLHRISYCADDKAEKRFFSFIAKEESGDHHTCYVFVSDKLAEEITLTIGQAFDLAYKRYMSGSHKEESSNIEQENGVLKQRLKELAGLLTPSQLNNFLDKHKIMEVCEMKQESPNTGLESAKVNKKSNTLDSSSGNHEDATDQLINLDVPVSKFDNMTLDDLNDDDFDPRAGDSDSSDDFNPRSSFSPSSHSNQDFGVNPALGTPHSFGSPAYGFGSPVANSPMLGGAGPGVDGTPNQSFNSPMMMSPPALPPRDPGKIQQKPVSTNPFGAAPTFGSNDPFGMSTFNTPGDKKSGAAFGSSSDVFADLDPLNK